MNRYLTVVKTEKWHLTSPLEYELSLSLSLKLVNEFCGVNYAVSDIVF